MASAKLSFLSSGEEALIHEKSLEALDDIGVLVRSESVLSLLDESGARVEKRRGIARISEDMVKESLMKAPKEFTLCARNSVNDVCLPTDGPPHLTTDGLTLYIRDLETGKNRSATKKDLADAARLADALDAVDFFWPIVTVSDVPPACHNLYELWTGLRSCEMHVQGDCTSASDAKKMIDLASLIAGGRDELKKRPLFSSATNPISPLSFDKGAVEAQVEFAKAGIPILCHSMSMSGMSAPVTIAGTIVNLNAENLASIVISQCASPGAPHIYGSCSMPANMRTGEINMSAPEGLLLSAAAGQMARRYGRPCMVSNWGMGRNGPGIKVSFSEAFAYAASVFASTDLVSGIGGLDCSKGCSLEQMVLDSYIWDNFRSFLRDFRINEEAIALDVMKEVGHGNSFISHPHTAKNLRRELHFWNEKKLAMEATLSDCMLSEARDVAKKLLKEHSVADLDRDVVACVERRLNDCAKNLR